MFVAQLGRHFSLLALLSWVSFAAAQHHHHHHHHGGISLILRTTVTTIIRTTCGRIITTKPFITLTKTSRTTSRPFGPMRPSNKRHLRPSL